VEYQELRKRLYEKYRILFHDPFLILLTVGKRLPNCALYKDIANSCERIYNGIQIKSESMLSFHIYTHIYAF
jgi:hypothetical protein